MKRTSVFILSSGSDTGGGAIRVVEAFKDNAHYDVRSMVASTNYIEYPTDLPWSRAGVETAYRKADLVVLNNTMYGYKRYDRGSHKPIVLMHHGWHYDGSHFNQTSAEIYADAARFGAIQTGSTANFELLAPENGPPVRWTPIPYDLDALRAMRQRLYRLDPERAIRIVHSPTNRAIKSTETLIKAVKLLQSRGLNVKLVLIEGQTHEITLRIKAEVADLVVDQLNLGYGCNAIEAWGMGIPVVGAVLEHPEWRAHMAKRFLLDESPTQIPMYEPAYPGVGSLAASIAHLVEDAELRRKWAEIGSSHAQRWHSHAAGVRIWSQIYEEVLNAVANPAQMSPV